MTETAVSYGFGVGISAIFASMFGIEPQAWVWAIFGCALGVPLAKPATRARAVIVFVSASFACALLGTGAAEHWFTGKVYARNILCLLIGFAFHPLMEKFLGAIPALWDGFLDFILRRAKP